MTIDLFHINDNTSFFNFFYFIYYWLFIYIFLFYLSVLVLVHVVLPSSVQAGLFYLPHLLWKSIEGKQVDLLLQDVHKSLFDEDSDKKIKNMIK